MMTDLRKLQQRSLERLNQIARETTRMTNWMWSPQCPVCGDEVSDSPDDDYPPSACGRTATYATECGGCGALLTVEVQIEVQRRAMTAKEL